MADAQPKNALRPLGRAALGGHVVFEIPLCETSSAWKRSIFVALGLEVHGRVDVVIEACTAVGWLPTASAYTGIPPEGHAALGEVLATLQLPPVPPTRRDWIVRGILRVVGVALLTAGTAVFATWAAVVISVFTGVAGDIEAALGRPDAPMLAVGVAFATMMAALLVNALTLGIVSRVCGEPSAATSLRARSGLRCASRCRAWAIPAAGPPNPSIDAPYHLRQNRKSDR